MNGYIAGLNGKTVELYAKTLYDAKMQALAHFKPRKRDLGLVWCMIAEKDGVPVVHTPDF